MQMGPGLTAARESIDRCSRDPVQLQYLALPSFDTQIEGLPVYLRGLKATAGKPVFVIAVGYWAKTPETPAKYLEILSSLRDKSSRIFIVNTATGYQPEDSRKQACLDRNAAMRVWVEAQGDPYYYVDYDALSSASAPKPPHPITPDKHFMCALWWSPRKLPQVRFDASRQGKDAAGNPLPQIPVGSLSGIQVTSDGRCADETNRNLWQMILNTLI